MKKVGRTIGGELRGGDREGAKRQCDPRQGGRGERGWELSGQPARASARHLTDGRVWALCCAIEGFIDRWTGLTTVLEAKLIISRRRWRRGWAELRRDERRGAGGPR